MGVSQVYRRGYRLYNRLWGNFRILDGRTITPLDDCEDIRTVGAVLLQGWISA